MKKERRDLPTHIETDKHSPYFGRKVSIKIGGAVITSAGNNAKDDKEADSKLKCEYVVHTVGPDFNFRAVNEEQQMWNKEKLGECYSSSIEKFLERTRESLKDGVV